MHDYLQCRLSFYFPHLGISFIAMHLCLIILVQITWLNVLGAFNCLLGLIPFWKTESVGSSLDF